MLPIETNSGLRYVVRGLRLKYWAMWLVIATPLAAVVAHYTEFDVWWTTGSILAMALLIDTIGRILCLMGRIVPSKSLMASASIQIGVILIAGGLSVEVVRQPEMGFLASLVLIPLAAVILSTMIRMYSNYGLLLVRLPRALSKQAEAPEDTVVMARLPDDSTRVHDR